MNGDFEIPEPAIANFKPQLGVSSADDINLIEDLTQTAKRTPQKRLEQIVEFDEEQAAAILKLWMHQGERA
jgi:flagellar biosynthesis/type III secretory pathway M-ring protein FliF/YscJ